MKDTKSKYIKLPYYDDPTFKSRSKTTEAELVSNWMYWNQKPERKDPFKLDELVVTPNGSKGRISECCGMNAEGDFEYYVESCIPTKLGGYYTEHELMYPNDAPPPPPTEKVEITKCDHKKAYENIISATLRFWVCPDCKEEVDAPKKRLPQTEIDEFSF